MTLDSDARWQQFMTLGDDIGPVDDVRPTGGIPSRLLTGLVWAAVTQWLMFPFTLGIVRPGLGLAWIVTTPWAEATSDASLTLSTAIAATLGVAAVVMAILVRAHPERRWVIVAAHRLGWIFLIDSGIYIGSLLVFATADALSEPVTAACWAAAIGLPQIPTFLLALSITRRSAGPAGKAQ